jgi:ribosomal protein S7
MPRRREVPERVIIPDAKYKNKLVSKFIASIMRDGKKSTAESLLYGAFDIISEKTNEDPLKVFEKALENVKPTLRSSPGVLAVRRIRFPQRSALPGERPWVFVGSSVLRGVVVKKDSAQSWPES